MSTIASSILLIYAPPHDMSIERARPNAEPSVPITGHQGNVRLRSTQSSGTVDEEQSQEIPAETHEGNEAYRDEPDISVRIVCIPMALAADNRLPWAPSALHWFAPGSYFSAPRRMSVCSRLPREKSLLPKCSESPRSSPNISNGIF
jgi:hypothetical protein